MHKKEFHMVPMFRLIILIAALFFYQKSSAQPETVIEDSVVKTDQVLYFDDISTLPPEPVAARSVPDTVLDKIRKDGAYWYANLTPPRQKEEQKAETGDSIYDQSWFITLLWIIIIGSFVTVLIWYLASSNISLFRKAPKALGSEAEQPVTEDIFALDYAAEIKKAVAVQNYRLAIRLFYLRTLKDLADRDIIQYKQAKTNSEYLSQLAGSPYYKKFFRLTRDFEYAWYGKAAVSSDAYAAVENEFIIFKKELP